MVVIECNSLVVRPEIITVDRFHPPDEQAAIDIGPGHGHVVITACLQVLETRASADRFEILNPVRQHLEFLGAMRPIRGHQEAAMGVFDHAFVEGAVGDLGCRNLFAGAGIQQCDISGSGDTDPAIWTGERGKIAVGDVCAGETPQFAGFIERQLDRQADQGILLGFFGAILRRITSVHERQVVVDRDELPWIAGHGQRPQDLAGGRIDQVHRVGAVTQCIFLAVLGPRHGHGEGAMGAFRDLPQDLAAGRFQAGQRVPLIAGDDHAADSDHGLVAATSSNC
jgi:hypothetical protein